MPYPVLTSPISRLLFMTITRLTCLAIDTIETNEFQSEHFIDNDPAGDILNILHEHDLLKYRGSRGGRPTRKPRPISTVDHRKETRFDYASAKSTQPQILRHLRNITIGDHTSSLAKKPMRDEFVQTPTLYIYLQCQFNRKATCPGTSPGRPSKLQSRHCYHNRDSRNIKMSSTDHPFSTPTIKLLLHLEKRLMRVGRIEESSTYNRQVGVLKEKNKFIYDSSLRELQLLTCGRELVRSPNQDPKRNHA